MEIASPLPMATELIQQVNLALLAIGIGLVLNLPGRATRSAGETSADELECEEAVARLVKCCPDLVPSTVNCEYREERGCGSTNYCVYHPDIDPGEGRRIRSLSCAQVAAEGICASVTSR